MDGVVQAIEGMAQIKAQAKIRIDGIDSLILAKLRNQDKSGHEKLVGWLVG